MSLETLYISQPILAGILAVIGLFIAFSIVFYTIKGLLYLIQFTVKQSLKLTELILKGGFNLAILPIKVEKKRKMEQQSNQNQQQSKIEIKVEENQMEEQAEFQFCPNCGQRFNSRVQAEFHRNGKCFCQNCGGLTQV